MQTALATQAPISTLVALTPSDVAPAQATLAIWCRQKLASLGAELREQRQCLRQATASKWNTKSWRGQISKTKARMIYYAKIKAAVEAGYLIVPNFDIEVFAVKTRRLFPPSTDDVTTAQPDLSPHRQGDYVDDVVFSRTETRRWVGSDDKPKSRDVDVPTGYDYEPDIPLRGVKPVILDATQRAMALKIFDQIGVVKARKQDPIIVGQIVQPGGNGRYWKKTVSFFVAWWLDPETL